MGSKPWGGAAVTSWAEDAEDNDQSAELPPVPAAYAAAHKKFQEQASLVPSDESAFPSLEDAKNQKGKKKKDKPKTVSLSQFAAGSYGSAKSAGPLDTGKLTVDEILMLPKAPRERDESEETGQLGGGFKGYGGFRGGDRSGQAGDRGGDRGGRGGDRGFGGREREREDIGPSRADEASDWSANRKFVPSAPPHSRDRYSDSGDRGGAGFDSRGGSRADEVTNWSASKAYVPSAEPRRRTGGGYDEDRRSGYNDGPSRADGVDRWGSASRQPISNGAGHPEGSAPGRPSERPRLVLQKRTTPLEGSLSAAPPASDGAKPDPFAGAKPRDVTLIPSKEESEVSNPDPSSTRPKPRSNPFGAARPREVLLEERGQDWKKIDLELERRAVDRPDSEEEIKLKEEIATLKARLEGKPKSEGESEAGPVEVAPKAAMSFKDKLAESIRKEEEGKELTEEAKTNLRNEISEFETKLAKITLELDDKVRFLPRPAGGENRVGRSESRGGDGPVSREVSASGSDGYGRRGDGTPVGREDWGRRGDGAGSRSDRYRSSDRQYEDRRGAGAGSRGGARW